MIIIYFIFIIVVAGAIRVRTSFLRTAYVQTSHIARTASTRKGSLRNTCATVKDHKKDGLEGTVNGERNLNLTIKRHLRNSQRPINKKDGLEGTVNGERNLNNPDRGAKPGTKSIG